MILAAVVVAAAGVDEEATVGVAAVDTSVAMMAETGTGVMTDTVAAVAVSTGEVVAMEEVEEIATVVKVVVAGKIFAIYRTP